MLLVNTLSRALLSGTGDDHEKFDNAQSTNYLALLDKRSAAIRDHLEIDTAMCLLCDAISRGWLNDKRTSPSDLTPYLKFPDKITVSQGLILESSNLFIPHSFRRNILESIHSAHLGMNQCTYCARELFFRPGMSSQIQDLILNRQLYQHHGCKPQKEPLMEQ